MKKYESFTNLYSLQKTLRFKLLPVGKTADHFKEDGLLEKEKRRVESYSKVKEYLDCYYKKYIDKVLSKVQLDDLRAYADLYYTKNKTPEQHKKMGKYEESFRKRIATALKSDESAKKLFGKDVFRDLPEELPDLGAGEKEHIAEFYNFCTYFSGFFENRKNMFTDEEKSTGIANRCVAENLPRFLDNAAIFPKIAAALSDCAEEIEATFGDLFGIIVKDMFEPEFFNCVLSQEGIDHYNQVLGGYSNRDSSKVQGLNEYINLYNQKASKAERLPKLKPLYKQILSDKTSVSFIPDRFENDNEVLGALCKFIAPEENECTLSSALEDLLLLAQRLPEASACCIYVKTGAGLSAVSKGAFGRWDAVFSGWAEEYDIKNGYRNTEAYYEKRRKVFGTLQSLSLSEIDRFGASRHEEDSEQISVVEWFVKKIVSEVADVKDAYKAAEPLVSAPYTQNQKLNTDEAAISQIKELLDSIKQLESTLGLLLGSGKEEDKDAVFYGEYLPIYDRLSQVDKLYDKVRNYMTQKPFSTEKIKLNFDNPQFLGGWDRNKERDYSAVLLKKGNDFFLAVMNSDARDVFQNTPVPAAGEPLYEKIVYKQISNSAKYFSAKQIIPQNPPQEIRDILEKKKLDNKSLTREEICKFIDYIKYDFLENYNCLRDENGNNYFDFSFRPSEEYASLNEFFKEVDKQAYGIRYNPVSEKYVLSLVDEKKVYLFRIYNKDFSAYSHGLPNLHTLYFRALFASENLQSPVFKLNGGAKMFYRPASIAENEQIVHPANQPLNNKNTLNPRRKSCFSYDLIKDKRYTEDQFMLYIPVTLNFSAPEMTNINEKVRQEIKACAHNYIIGIDRGERNLLYISVVDESGKIVEQSSLNIINHDTQHDVDYHALLQEKEEERMKSRKNWSKIESIRELKEGYISQAVHKICKLAEKYDAVIAMEDLNRGFKNSRSAVEKSVYQKFEKMLIDKLNFYADKKRDPLSTGGVLKAYQLTNKFESFKKMRGQNGFIFYVPAWLTSKIDPTTGFVDLLYPKYESIAAAKAFFKNFDRISYSDKDGWFEFEFDYNNFARGSTAYRKKWTLCSFGKRVKTFRDPLADYQYRSSEVDLTAEFKALFEHYGIACGKDMKRDILAQTQKEFFQKLIQCMKLLLQMRNSVPRSPIDYLISPVKNSSGSFYCSNHYTGSTAELPIDADANGAYHIARKAQYLIEKIKSTPDSELRSARLFITNAEWLEYVQK